MKLEAARTKLAGARKPVQRAAAIDDREPRPRLRCGFRPGRVPWRHGGKARHDPGGVHRVAQLLDTAGQEDSRPGTQVAVRLSFKRNGEIFGMPRVTYVTPGIGTPSKPRSSAARRLPSARGWAARLLAARLRSGSSTNVRRRKPDTTPHLCRRRPGRQCTSGPADLDAMVSSMPYETRPPRCLALSDRPGSDAPNVETRRVVAIARGRRRRSQCGRQREGSR